MKIGRAIRLMAPFLLLFPALPCLAEVEIDLNYEVQSEEKSERYDRALKIRVRNVNRIDYKYEVEIEALPPKPFPSFGAGKGMPGPLGGQKAPTNTDLEKCADTMTHRLTERMVHFGDKSLDDWKNANLSSVQCSNVDPGVVKVLVDKIAADFADDPGILKIDDETLKKALEGTNAGGALIIRISATPEHSVAVVGADGASLDLKKETAKCDLDPAITEECEKHTRQRQYKVIFELPHGVVFSFGPYLSGVQRHTFKRLSNPDFDGTSNESQFIIGRDDDSSYTYGVAAHWNGALNSAKTVGISWGMAYTLQETLENAVNGLIGFYGRSRVSSLRVHLGMAVGREQGLADRRYVDGPIGSTEEISTTNKTVLRWFAAVSFSFGGDK